MTVILMLLINLVIKLPLSAQRLSLLLVTIVAIASVAGVGFTENLPSKILLDGMATFRYHWSYYWSNYPPAYRSKA